MWHGQGRMRSGRDRLQVLGGGQQFVLDPASGGRRGRRRGIGRRAGGKASLGGGFARLLERCGFVA